MRMNKKSEKQTKDDYLQIRLPKTLKEKLRELSTQQDRSVSYIALKAIEIFVSKQ